MKHIIKFQNYLKEGVSSENIINMMVEIILERIDIETIIANKNDRYKQKPVIEYTYKTFFNAYKDNDFIKQMLKFFKEENRNPKIKFQFERKFNYNYQSNGEEQNGYYNTNTSDIQVNIFEIGTDISKIKSTLSHELRHLYDDVVRKGTNSTYDNETSLPYRDKPSEIRARISGFINSYTGWDKDINSIIEDSEKALKSTNYDRKKLLKLLYSIKNTGLKKHTIIPTKKFEGRKSDIDGFVKEMNTYGLFNNYENDHRIIEIDNSILSVNSVDENTGELGYPLLDLLFDIYSKKSINILIDSNNLELVDIIKTRYNQPIIRVRQKYHWSNKNKLKIKYLVSKNGKIPHYEKIADTQNVGVDYDKLVKGFQNTNVFPTSENLIHYCKEIGLSETYMITLLQTFLDKDNYFYLYKYFYNKWADRLDLSKVDIHYFETKNKDEITGIYLLNGEKNKSILMDRVEQSLNYKKIK